MIVTLSSANNVSFRYFDTLRVYPENVTEYSVIDGSEDGYLHSVYETGAMEQDGFIELLVDWPIGMNLKCVLFLEGTNGVLATSKSFTVRPSGKEGLTAERTEPPLESSVGQETPSSTAGSAAGSSSSSSVEESASDNLGAESGCVAAVDAKKIWSLIVAVASSFSIFIY